MVSLKDFCVMEVLPLRLANTVASMDLICGYCSWPDASGGWTYRLIFLWELIEKGKALQG